MEKLTKITVNGQAIKDCPKCQGEDSMYAVTELKWGKANGWQHFSRCELCGHETRVK